MSVTRVASVADAAPLAATLRENRSFLAPWEPLRDEKYFTVQAQRAALERALDAYARESMIPLVILDGGQVVGRITINGITRGAF